MYRLIQTLRFLYRDVVCAIVIRFLSELKQPGEQTSIFQRDNARFHKMLAELRNHSGMGANGYAILQKQRLHNVEAAIIVTVDG